MTVIYVIIAILFFGLLVSIHEFGHFIVAKSCGIRVEEFSVGMGPAVISKQKGETKYSLRCIPFGGYCAMTGEDGASEDPRAFVNQAVWKRFLVLIAGSFMNLLLGFVIMFCLYADAEAFIAPKIASFMEGCPYEAADGLQEGDRFLKIDGHRIYISSDLSDYLDVSDTHDIVVLREGKRIKLNSFHMERIDYDGYENKMYGFNLGYDEGTVGNKLKYSMNMCCEFVRWVIQGLKQLFSGQASVKDLSGPVGIVDMMAETGAAAESAADALYSIFYIGAFIAVDLAAMNILPIPALDGGRIFSLIITWIIESVTHRKLNPKYEAYIHAAGMILLLALMAYVMFNDIFKLFAK
ncbi:MAG: M50 family metallopeptidase [Eubacteriales bacterium]|nr:M50 family metallopeptidase [Eubacteriales bacterium]